jgi:hypothetical protein
MAAGQGFKTFVTGEVLTAGDVNGYLMQGINVFANTTARDAAITAPAEGQFAFTKDNNSLWYYDGAAWVASGAAGDIEGVTAGVGISGGGTSGTVTVTNSMATAIDAKGDLVPGTGADTFARLAVGANGTVLTADSAEATGLKWATAASGGMTLLSTTTLTGASVTVSSISSSYNNLFIYFNKLYPSTNGSQIRFRLNGSTTSSNYNYQPSGDNYFNFPVSSPSNATNGQLGNANLEIFNYANTTTWKQYSLTQSTTQSSDDNNWVGGGKSTESWTSINAINSITIFASSGNINGTMLIYGVK